MKLNRLQKRGKVLGLDDNDCLPNLLDVCQALRHSKSGFSDPMDKKEFRKYVKYLKTVLKTWEDTVCDSCDGFDFAIKDMIEATIVEIGEDL